uniref:PyrC3 n=1 Tax=Streptomyces rugosporus TaxID=295838 RepID=K7QQA6_STRRG|nr:PyrC3 [Streptomyces rugosporus]
MPRQLITVLGASCLLGTAIAAELAGRPVGLRLVARRRTPPPEGRADVDVRTADLADDHAVAEAVDGADVVICLVAPTVRDNWRGAAHDTSAERITVGLVRRIVEAARGRARPPVVLFAGSMSEVGRSARAGLDGTEIDEPLTVYDRHKLEAERALEAAHAEGLVRGCTLRLPALYGLPPGHGLVAAMVGRALAGEPLPMWHDGTVLRDFLWAGDAARAFTAALDGIDVVGGGHWLVGSGQATSIGELFETIAKVVAAHTGRPAVPVRREEPAQPLLPTDLVDLVVNPAAFQAATGWAPRVPLVQGLERMVAGYHEAKAV